MSKNIKNSHQVSQGQIPTANQIMGISNPDEEQMRQTMGKIQRPKISKQMPAPFNLIGMKKGKKNFQAFSKEQEQRQNDNNFFLDKLDDAVNAEEYKLMQNLLQPITLDRAHTKIDQYSNNLPNAQRGKKSHHPGGAGGGPAHGYQAHGLSALDPLPQLDGISQLLQNTSQKQMMNLSSAFSNYDSYHVKNIGGQPGPNQQQQYGSKIAHGHSNYGGHSHMQPKHLELRLDQMITLGVFKSTSGTIKKMLHAPTLKMYAVKEVPIANVQIRQMLIDWIANWQHNCCYSYGGPSSQNQQASSGQYQTNGYSAVDSFIKIHSTQWNSPEGCVSVIQDYAANGSLYNLTQSIGAVPESILKHLAKQILRALDFMHDQNMTHSNICASQIVFDRKGRTKLSAGFNHILRYKQEVQSTLNQHFSLVQILSDSLENYKNRQSLIKQKFSHLSANPIDGGPSASLMHQSYANNFSAEACVKELKKQDLFDLGILLILAATGDLEMINEEYLQKIPNMQTSCCLIHAVKNFAGNTDKPDKQALTLVKIFNRLSENCQTFICWCMQQRFSKNEMKRFHLTKVCTAADLRNHPWIMSSHDQIANFDTKNPQDQNQIMMKKKKSQFVLHNDDHIQVILSLKELLNVSSDWMDVKGKGVVSGASHTAQASQASTSAGGSVAGGGIAPTDFQQNQIERIIDALTLALPSRSGTGGYGMNQNQMNTTQPFLDSDIKELSYDIGVDPRILKFKLQKHFNQNQQLLQ